MKDINIKTEELDFTKPISFYSKYYGLSVNAIRNRFKKLGIYNKFIYTEGNSSIIRSKQLQEEYNKNAKRCLNCSDIISYSKRKNNYCSTKCSGIIISYSKRKNNYCSTKCSGIHTQKDGGNCKWSDIDKINRSLWAKKYAYRIPTKPKINKTCIYCNNNFYVIEFYKNRKFCSKECYDKCISKTGYLKGKSGGLRQKSGRGKQGWYKGYFCNSSWELAWIIYQLEHGLQFKRNKDGFKYEFQGKQFKFYPDFILDNGEYVEVKGYMDGKQKAKIESFPYKLYIIGKEEIKPYIKYVEEKYGKDYINEFEECH